jgi:hypothetical protein
MVGYEEVADETPSERIDLPARGSTSHKRESLAEFQEKITTMVDIYARLHLKARFWSRTVLLITLGFSAISAGMNLMTIWIEKPTIEVQWLLRVATVVSLMLVIASLMSTIWGLDQRASDCNYAFRRLVSVRTKLRLANDDEAVQLQKDYAEFGDDLPQIGAKKFTKLWNLVMKERDERKERDARRREKEKIRE